MPTIYPLADFNLRHVESDHLTVRELDDAVILTFPHDVPLDIGHARVSEDGTVVFVAPDGWVPPAAGESVYLGEFSPALWDGSQIRRRPRFVLQFTGDISGVTITATRLPALPSTITAGDTLAAIVAAMDEGAYQASNGAPVDVTPALTDGDGNALVTAGPAGSIVGGEIIVTIPSLPGVSRAFGLTARGVVAADGGTTPDPDAVTITPTSLPALPSTITAGMTVAEVLSLSDLGVYDASDGSTVEKAGSIGDGAGGAYSGALQKDDDVALSVLVSTGDVSETFITPIRRVAAATSEPVAPTTIIISRSSAPDSAVAGDTLAILSADGTGPHQWTLDDAGGLPIEIVGAAIKATGPLAAGSYGFSVTVEGASGPPGLSDIVQFEVTEAVAPTILVTNAPYLVALSTGDTLAAGYRAGVYDAPGAVETVTWFVNDEMAGENDVMAGDESYRAIISIAAPGYQDHLIEIGPRTVVNTTPAPGEAGIGTDAWRAMPGTTATFFGGTLGTATLAGVNVKGAFADLGGGRHAYTFPNATSDQAALVVTITDANGETGTLTLPGVARAVRTLSEIETVVRPFPTFPDETPRLRLHMTHRAHCYQGLHATEPYEIEVDGVVRGVAPGILPGMLDVELSGPNAEGRIRVRGKGADGTRGMWSKFYVQPAVARASIVFGAKTLAGKGGHALPAGATSITNAGGTGLTVQGGKIAPAVAGVVQAGTITFDNGVQRPITVAPNAYSAATMGELEKLMEDIRFTRGTDRIYLRGIVIGGKNADGTQTRYYVNRKTTTGYDGPAGGVIRIEDTPDETTCVFRCLEISGGSSSERNMPFAWHIRDAIIDRGDAATAVVFTMSVATEYMEWHGIRFRSVIRRWEDEQKTLGGGVSSAIYRNGNDAKHLQITDCDFADMSYFIQNANASYIARNRVRHTMLDSMFIQHGGTVIEDNTFSDYWVSQKELPVTIEFARIIYPDGSGNTGMPGGQDLGICTILRTGKRTGDNIVSPIFTRSTYAGDRNEWKMTFHAGNGDLTPWLRDNYTKPTELAEIDGQIIGYGSDGSPIWDDGEWIAVDLNPGGDDSDIIDLATITAQVHVGFTNTHMDVVQSQDRGIADSKSEYAMAMYGVDFAILRNVISLAGITQGFENRMQGFLMQNPTTGSVTALVAGNMGVVSAFKGLSIEGPKWVIELGNLWLPGDVTKQNVRAVAYGNEAGFEYKNTLVIGVIATKHPMLATAAYTRDIVSAEGIDLATLFENPTYLGDQGDVTLDYRVLPAIGAQGIGAAGNAKMFGANFDTLIFEPLAYNPRLQWDRDMSTATCLVRTLNRTGEVLVLLDADPAATYTAQQIADAVDRGDVGTFRLNLTEQNIPASDHFEDRAIPITGMATVSYKAHVAQRVDGVLSVTSMPSDHTLLATPDTAPGAPVFKTPLYKAAGDAPSATGGGYRHTTGSYQAGPLFLGVFGPARTKVSRGGVEARAIGENLVRTSDDHLQFYRLPNSPAGPITVDYAGVAGTNKMAVAVWPDPLGPVRVANKSGGDKTFAPDTENGETALMIAAGTSSTFTISAGPITERHDAIGIIHGRFAADAKLAGGTPEIILVSPDKGFSDFGAVLAIFGYRVGANDGASPAPSPGATALPAYYAPIWTPGGNANAVGSEFAHTTGSREAGALTLPIWGPLPKSVKRNGVSAVKVGPATLGAAAGPLQFWSLPDTPAGPIQIAYTTATDTTRAALGSWATPSGTPRFDAISGGTRTHTVATIAGEKALIMSAMSGTTSDFQPVGGVTKRGQATSAATFHSALADYPAQGGTETFGLNSSGAGISYASLAAIYPAGATTGGGTTITAPGKPTNFAVVTDSPTQATITYGPPASNGGSPIDRYSIRREDTVTGVVVGFNNSASVMSFTSTGLVAGREYKWSVEARNEAGLVSGYTTQISRTQPAASTSTASVGTMDYRHMDAPTGTTSTSPNPALAIGPADAGRRVLLASFNRGGGAAGTALGVVNSTPGDAAKVGAQTGEANLACVNFAITPIKATGLTIDTTFNYVDPNSTSTPKENSPNQQAVMSVPIIGFGTTPVASGVDKRVSALGVTSLSVAVTVQAGDLIVAALGTLIPNGTATPVGMTFAGGGLSWTKLSGATSSTNFQAHMAHARAATAGTITVTATPSTGMTQPMLHAIVLRPSA